MQPLLDMDHGLRTRHRQALLRAVPRTRSGDRYYPVPGCGRLEGQGADRTRPIDPCDSRWTRRRDRHPASPIIAMSTRGNACKIDTTGSDSATL